MRALVQRVLGASVQVEGKIVGKIDRGLLVLLGFHQNDAAEKIPWMVDKLIHLRIFSDEAGKMNLSLQDIQGSILVVSQFTLYGACKAGRRPSFIESMPSDKARPLYEQFVEQLERKLGKERVQTGQFGALMQVELINDGPVTLLVEPEAAL